MVTPLRDGELSLSNPDDSWVLSCDGTFELDADERRRRCEKDPPVEKEEVGVRDARTEVEGTRRLLDPSGYSELDFLLRTCDRSGGHASSRLYEIDSFAN